MFEGQPKGLYALALANTGERFGYYTMLAIFVLFLKANFGLSPGMAGTIYSTFLALVYFLPFIGGILADKFGYGKMVTIGIIAMFAGYVLLALPLGSGTLALACMFSALLVISTGTGLFKGNLQVMVGNLYDSPEYASKRDSAFSIFYMAINIGALFAPTAAVKIMEYAQQNLGVSVNDSYHFAFGVACVSLIISMAIYYSSRRTFKHVEGNIKQTSAGKETAKVEELSPRETKDRIIALCLVFAVVIFFWMAFHQNGLTLTYFADEFTAKSSTGLESMMFDVWNLVAIIFIVYGLFSLFQSSTGKGKAISGIVILLALAFLGYRYSSLNGSVPVDAPIFQQFNPFFVVALTPVSMAIFGALSRKGKEPSAPRKIGLGMLVAACGFILMMFSSFGLLTPEAQSEAIQAGTASFVSPNWLISTYLVLLLLVIGTFFIRRQLRQEVPILPLDLMRIPIFALSVLSSITSFTAQLLAMVSLPFYLQNVAGRNEVETGLLLTPWPVATILTAPVAGRLIEKYHPGLLGGIGMVVYATGLLLLALLPGQPTNMDIAWRLMLCGMGFGLFQTPNNSTMISAAPRSRSGGANGMQGTARLLGQTLGTTFVALIFSVTSATDSMPVCMYVAIGFALVAAIVSCLRISQPVPMRGR